jgi:hypothetical protein
VKELRSRLTAARIASVAPFGDAIFAQALSSGHLPSAALHGRVCSAVHAAPAAAAVGASTLSVAGVSLLLAAAAGCAWWIAHARPRRPAPIATAPIASAAAPAVARAAPAPVAFDRHTYLFMNGPPPLHEVEVVSGAWRWLPDQRAMITQPGTILGFRLPLMPPGPVVITTRATLAPGGANMRYGSLLHRTMRPIPVTGEWRNRAVLPSLATLTTYLIDGWIVECADRIPVRVTALAEGHDRAEFILYAGDLVITEIDIGAVTESEIPVEMRDPQALTSVMLRVSDMTVEERERFENDLTPK